MRVTSFPCQPLCLNNNKYHQAIFLKITSSLQNSLKVACMEMKLGTHVYYIISMTPTCFYDDSNLLTVPRMEMKLGTNAYDIISITTTYYLNNNKYPKAFTSSLLKLSNGSTHGDETCYACVLHHFHDDNSHFSLLLIFFIYCSLSQRYT